MSIVGFTDKMPDIMAMSDVLPGKPDIQRRSSGACRFRRHRARRFGHRHVQYYDHHPP